MPELPEVETTRRDVAPRIIGRAITAVWMADPGPLRHVVPLDTAGRGAGGESQPHRGRGPALARLDALLGDPVDVDEG